MFSADVQRKLEVRGFQFLTEDKMLVPLYSYREKVVKPGLFYGVKESSVSRIHYVAVQLGKSPETWSDQYLIDRLSQREFRLHQLYQAGYQAKPGLLRGRNDVVRVRIPNGYYHSASGAMGVAMYLVHPRYAYFNLTNDQVDRLLSAYPFCEHLQAKVCQLGRQTNAVSSNVYALSVLVPGIDESLSNITLEDIVTAPVYLNFMDNNPPEFELVPRSSV